MSEKETRLQEFDRRIGEQRDKGASVAGATAKVASRMLKERCQQRRWMR